MKQCPPILQLEPMRAPSITWVKAQIRVPRPIAAVSTIARGIGVDIAPRVLPIFGRSRETIEFLMCFSASGSPVRAYWAPSAALHKEPVQQVSGPGSHIVRHVLLCQEIRQPLQRLAKLRGMSSRRSITIMTEEEYGLLLTCVLQLVTCQLLLIPIAEAEVQVVEALLLPST